MYLSYYVHIQATTMEQSSTGMTSPHMISSCSTKPFQLIFRLQSPLVETIQKYANWSTYINLFLFSPLLVELSKISWYKVGIQLEQEEVENLCSEENFKMKYWKN